MTHRFLALALALGLPSPLFAQAPGAPTSSASNANAPSSVSADDAPPPPPEDTNLPSFQAIATRLNTLEARLAHGQAPNNPANLALLRFKLEQAHLLFWQAQANPSYAPWSHRQLALVAERASAVSRATSDAAFSTPPAEPESTAATPPTPPRGAMHERAYMAADGSVQPFWVFVPRNYSPSRRYPLVVFLHGYDPAISKIQPWIPAESTWGLATGRGYILVVPYGRRNSDFVNIGEDDTMDVLKDVRRHYSIDAERTFLLGTSMGGYGVYAVGLHHPDPWAGIAAMSARSDFYLWFKINRNDVEPWKRLLYDADDPRHLKINALHMPIFIQHGAQDSIVNVEHSRRFSADLRALKFDVRYREVPNGTHYIYWEASSYQLALDWMNRLRRTYTPRRVAYTTGTLRNDRAYWVQIQGFNNYGKLASIDATVLPNNIVRVSLDNVARFTLRPPAAFFKAGQPVSLEVNGHKQTDTYPASGPISWPPPATTVVPTAGTPASGPDNSSTAFPGTKTAQKSGQIKNCYRDPFLLVYGTLGEQQTTGARPVTPTTPDTNTPTGGTTATPNERGNDAANTENAPEEQLNVDKANALRFQDEWYRFADGIPPIKADKEVTADDRKHFNLILFGTRQSNSIIAEIADRLPLELTPTGYRMGKDEKTGTHLGLQLCYPSPFDPARMIVVQSGTYWGDMLPINHKYDLLPDYIVYDDAIDKTDSTNHTIEAGYFDGNWQLVAAPVKPAGAATPAASKG